LWSIDWVRRRLVVVSISLGAFGAFGVLGAIAGCSLLTDLSGLSSSTPRADGSATGDGAGKDSGGLGEDGPDGSGGDGSTEGGAPDASGCARYPGTTFCVDFDQPSPLTTPPWTENDALDTNPGGTIALTTSAPISAPNAARFMLAASTDNCSYLRLVKKFPGSFGGIVTRFDMRAEDSAVYYSLGVTINPSLRFTILVSLGIDKLVHLFVQRGDSTITEIGSDSVDLDLPWPGRWISLTLEYKSQPTKGVTLTIPGARPLFVSLPADFVASDPQLTIGPFCEGNLTRATFDDVAAWLTP
jgi:hypothetical protein